MSGYTYILTNSNNKVLYTGSTNCIERRLADHKTGVNRNSFSNRYNVTKLVLLEKYKTYREAFKREKQIKHLHHNEKVSLIKQINPEWRDLSENIKTDDKRRAYKR